MTSKEQAQMWIDVMADNGAIGHYREKAVVAYLARLLDRVKRDERKRLIDWLGDWDERRKGYTSEQADALAEAADFFRAQAEQHKGSTDG